MQAADVTNKLTQLDCMPPEEDYMPSSEDQEWYYNQEHTPPVRQNAADEILHQFIKIGQLSNLQDDWDSYGGKGISLKVCKKAVKYLYVAFTELSNELGSVTIPFIAPANDGSLVFEWKSDKAELIVVFHSNQQLDVEYLTVEKEDGSEHEKEGLFNSETDFVQAVTWFSLREA